jgi:hypothetical protein
MRFLTAARSKNTSFVRMVMANGWDIDQTFTAMACNDYGDCVNAIRQITVVNADPSITS